MTHIVNYSAKSIGCCMGYFETCAVVDAGASTEFIGSRWLALSRAVNGPHLQALADESFK